jgi:hypothetical protein
MSTRHPTRAFVLATTACLPPIVVALALVLAWVTHPAPPLTTAPFCDWEAPSTACQDLVGAHVSTPSVAAENAMRLLAAASHGERTPLTHAVIAGLDTTSPADSHLRLLARRDLVVEPRAFAPVDRIEAPDLGVEGVVIDGPFIPELVAAYRLHWHKATAWYFERTMLRAHRMATAAKRDVLEQRRRRLSRALIASGLAVLAFVGLGVVFARGRRRTDRRFIVRGVVGRVASIGLFVVPMLLATMLPPLPGIRLLVGPALLGFLIGLPFVAPLAAWIVSRTAPPHPMLPIEQRGTAGARVWIQQQGQRTWMRRGTEPPLPTLPVQVEDDLDGTVIALHDPGPFEGRRSFIGETMVLALAALVAGLVVLFPASHPLVGTEILIGLGAGMVGVVAWTAMAMAFVQASAGVRPRNGAVRLLAHRLETDDGRQFFLDVPGRTVTLEVDRRGMRLVLENEDGVLVLWGTPAELAAVQAYVEGRATSTARSEVPAELAELSRASRAAGAESAAR